MVKAGSKVQFRAVPVATVCESTKVVVLVMLARVAVPVMPVPLTAMPGARPVVLARVTVLVPLGVQLLV